MFVSPEYPCAFRMPGTCSLILDRWSSRYVFRSRSPYSSERAPEDGITAVRTFGFLLLLRYWAAVSFANVVLCAHVRRGNSAVHDGTICVADPLLSDGTYVMSIPVCLYKKPDLLADQVHLKRFHALMRGLIIHCKRNLYMCDETYSSWVTMQHSRASQLRWSLHPAFALHTWPMF